jgi:hypothetical protein
MPVGEMNGRQAGFKEERERELALGKMTPTLIFIFKEENEEKKKKTTDVLMPRHGVGK